MTKAIAPFCPNIDLEVVPVKTDLVLRSGAKGLENDSSATRTRVVEEESRAATDPCYRLEQEVDGDEELPSQQAQDEPRHGHGAPFEVQRGKIALSHPMHPAATLNVRDVRHTHPQHGGTHVNR